MENLELGSVKNLRKSLLLTATIGIFLARISNFSTGKVEFLGFSIPVNDSEILPEFFGLIIIFFFIALIIRYSDEEFQKYYKKSMNDIGAFYGQSHDITEEERSDFAQSQRLKISVLKKSTLFLDIIFPILLGLGAIIYIFFF